MKYRLSDLAQIKYGKDHKKLNSGTIPVYGSGGIMRYVDTYLYDSESVLIPRKGSLNNLFFVKGKFWTVDTIFWTIINTDIIIPKYLYYKLKTIDLASMNVGSAVPSLTAALLNEISISIPDLQEQRRVLNVIEPFENKISLNTKINDNLLKIMDSLFFKEFLEIARPHGTISEFVNIKRGASPRPITKYLTNSGRPWIKISDVTTLRTPFISQTKEFIANDGIEKSRTITPGTLILSNSATPGIPIISDITASVHDGWLIISDYKLMNQEWFYLFFRQMRRELVSQSNGSVFRNLKTDIVKKFEVPLVNKEELDHFEQLISPIFSYLKILKNENIKLNEVKASLLHEFL